MGRRSVRLDFREWFTTEDMPRALAILTRALGAVGCVARAGDVGGRVGSSC
jgi:hypothetical protein